MNIIKIYFEKEFEVFVAETFDQKVEYLIKKKPKDYCTSKIHNNLFKENHQFL